MWKAVALMNLLRKLWYSMCFMDMEKQEHYTTSLIFAALAGYNVIYPLSSIKFM